MAKYLRLHVVTSSPETVLAQEYESGIYLSREAAPILPAAVWESDIFPTEQLAILLQKRGWHQTDIGDELNDARIAHRSAA